MAGLVPENSGHSNPMHPALPSTRKTIVKRRRPHCRSWDCHDKVASYVGKEAGPSRIGSDMHDPICFICFPCYQPIKSRSIKQIHMFPCSRNFCLYVTTFRGVGRVSVSRPSFSGKCGCVCVHNNNTQTTQNSTKVHTHKHN